MTPADLARTLQHLPHTLAFHYYDDRESPWLLARAMGERVSISALKASPEARFLNRPLVKPMVAACGGTLALADVAAAANADGVAWDGLSKVASLGVLAALEATWHDFELTFAAWGFDDRIHPADRQTSRPGGNLVVQVAFPSDHALLLTGLAVPELRSMSEYDLHPIRRGGRPTLSWARIDIEDGVALIEEVQTDWMRSAAFRFARARHIEARSRNLRALALYEAQLQHRYGKLWPTVTLLATLHVLAEFLGVREAYMHQPRAGAAFKGIGGIAPPVSLYTRLPKSFGFRAVNETPPFLRRRRKRLVAKLAREGEPLFWRLSL